MREDISIEEMAEEARALLEALAESGVEASENVMLDAVARAQGFDGWTQAKSTLEDASFVNRVGGEPQGDLVSGSIRIPPRARGAVRIGSGNANYFTPHFVRIIGWSTKNPHLMRRFAVGNITVGGCPQNISYTQPQQPIENSIIGDAFSCKGKPVRVNWPAFSHEIARNLAIEFININDEEICVSYNIWGEAMSSLQYSSFQHL